MGFKGKDKSVSKIIFHLGFPRANPCSFQTELKPTPKTIYPLSVNSETSQPERCTWKGFFSKNSSGCFIKPRGVPKYILFLASLSAKSKSLFPSSFLICSITCEQNIRSYFFFDLTSFWQDLIKSPSINSE